MSISKVCCSNNTNSTGGIVLIIRIAKLADGRTYTTLTGASGTMVFRFDEDTGDDKRASVVEFRPWPGGEITLEQLTV